MNGESPDRPEEQELVEQALHAADSGSAGHWPTVAAVLADEVRRLRAVLDELAWGTPLEDP